MNTEQTSKNIFMYDFKYLSQEFDDNVLDLVSQKYLYSYECMSGFEKFKAKNIVC